MMSERGCREDMRRDVVVLSPGEIWKMRLVTGGLTANSKQVCEAVSVRL